MEGIEKLIEITHKEELISFIFRLGAEQIHNFLYVIEQTGDWSEIIGWVSQEGIFKITYRTYDWKEKRKMSNFLDKELEVYQIESDNDTYNLVACEDILFFDIMDIMKIKYSLFTYRDLE